MNTRGLHLPLAATLAAVAGLPAASQEGSASTDVVFDTFVDQTKIFVRAGAKNGLTVGTSVTIVGAPAANGERSTLGTATVMEVFPEMARVSMDRAAQAASGEKWAKLPAPKVAASPQPRSAAPSAAAPAAAAPAPARGAKLKGRATITSFVKRVSLTNENDFAWTNCDLRLNDGRHVRPYRLAAWRKDTIRLGAFVGPLTEVLPTHIDVTCAEGSARFAFGG